MQKLAYSEMYGREVATRAFVDAESKDLEKSADNGEDISEERYALTASLADDLAYRGEQQKLAHDQGALKMLSTMEEIIEKGASTDEVLSEVREARSELQKSASMAPESDEEDQEMFDRMVKGAMEAWSSLTGQEPDEEMEKSARNLVAQQLKAANQ
jgi:hypothetical protein